MYRAGLVDSNCHNNIEGVWPPLLKTNTNFIISTEYAYTYFTTNGLVDIVT